MTTVTARQPHLPRMPAGRSEPLLGELRRALAGLSTPKLQALRSLAFEPSPLVPALMLWIEHATAWELDRRAGRAYALHAPAEAIDTREFSPCLLALAALSRRFGPEHPDVERLFGAISQSLDLRPVVH